MYYRPGDLYNNIVSLLLTLLSNANKAILQTTPIKPILRVMGGGHEFNDGEEIYRADVSVLLDKDGQIAVEIMSWQPWNQVRRLAKQYQALHFAHLVCFKVARIDHVDALFYIHFDFVRSTAHTCCFGGLNVDDHLLVDFHPPQVRWKRLRDLINQGDETEDGNLDMTLDLLPPHNILSLVLYKVPLVSHPVEVSSLPIPIDKKEGWVSDLQVPTLPIPMDESMIEGSAPRYLPIQYTDVSVNLDLKYLVANLSVLLQQNLIADWNDKAIAGQL